MSSQRRLIDLYPRRTSLHQVPNLRTNHLLNKIKKKISSSTHLPILETRTLGPFRLVILVVTPIHQRVQSRNRTTHDPLRTLLNITTTIPINRLHTLTRSSYQ